MASGDSVQQIKDRLSIVDVVAPYVELHPAGKNMKGKSPFTPEKTPSFFVSPDRGMYYCFSSSKGGDMFTFIQEMEGVDFKESLKILAEKAGVELVPEDPKKRTEREQGYGVLEEAAQFFEKKLRSFKAAETYLKDRGVIGETIAKWRLGYAPGPPQGGWREVRTHLSEKKFSDQQMIKAGLIKSAGEGKEPYDVFRDRVMFPIFDANGKVVAFSGRILSKDSDAPKYVNSPETEFFNKSEILYGYDKAKQGIRKFDFSLIVEGQFDVVLSHQAGYNNTVAVSGTALTDHHVSLLQRLSNRVVLALDADRAGIAAVKRAADLMLIRGMDVKVAKIPEGSDPADIVGRDVTEFKAIIGKATHVIEFLLAVLKDQANDERQYKLRVRDEVVPYIAKMENKIDADHFEGVVAEAIGSSKDAVHAEALRIKTEEQSKPKSVKEVLAEKAEPASVKHNRLSDLEAYVVVASSLVDEKMRQVLEESVLSLTGRSLKEVSANIPAEKTSELTFTLEQRFAEIHPKQLADEVGSKLREYQLCFLRDTLTGLKTQLSAAEASQSESEINELLQKITTVQKQLASATSAENPLVELETSEEKG